MKPRLVTDIDLEINGGQRITIGAPQGLERDIRPLEVMVRKEDNINYVLIPWKLESEEIETLKNGGTLWISIIGFPISPIGCQVTD